MHHYAPHLIYYVTVVNEHYLLHLTNGIRRSSRPATSPTAGYILNQDGLRLVEPPKVSKEKLAESKLKLGSSR
jgi:hypothetical protein